MDDYTNEHDNVNPSYFTKVVMKSGMTWIICRHCNEEIIHGTQITFPHKDYCHLRGTQNVSAVKPRTQDGAGNFAGEAEATPAEPERYPREVLEL